VFAYYGCDSLYIVDRQVTGLLLLLLLSLLLSYLT